MEPKLGGLTGEVAALLVGLAVCAFLLRAAATRGHRPDGRRCCVTE